MIETVNDQLKNVCQIEHSRHRSWLNPLVHLLAGLTGLWNRVAPNSFMAGLIAGLAEGRGLREAVLRGSACASIVVAKPGCAPAMPDPAELKAFLDTHSGPTQG